MTSFLPLSDSVDAQKSEANTAGVAEPTDSQLSQIWPVTESDVAYLHHTSGTSTGLPKPIPQTHRAAVGVLPSFDNGHVSATFTTTPLYHGGIADCFRAWTSSALIWLFPGRDVPITARNIMSCLDCADRATADIQTPNVRYFSSVPYVLQMMAAEPDGLEILKRMDLVGVGGAALPASVGDDLVSYGVNLVSRFGSAECGFLMSSHRRYWADKAWQYLRLNQSPHLAFELQGDGTAELIIKPSWPHMAKRNRDDASFATADLFESHRTIPDAWRYHARADSQLTLATGKKFDPAPLEAAIATSPLLGDVLIFGNGEQHPGALLFPSTESAESTADSLIEGIWPLIAGLNRESQPHTRLSRSMLVVMPKDTPKLEKSSKGTTMRGSAEKQYAGQISKAYESEVGDEDHSAAVPDEAIPVAVLEIIKNVIDARDNVPEDVDLYSFGVDSVACMRIRASLQSKIVSASTAKLPLNIVYDCGTIKRISQYLLAVRRGKALETEDEISQMRTHVSRYSTFNDCLNSSSVDSNGATTHLDKHNDKGEVVILTGATGALGAHVLAELRSSPRVAKIHCLVRAASTTAARERVSKSLLTRNKAPLDDASDLKIRCHPCKLSEPSLGLSTPPTTNNGESPNLYTSLARHTTVIIHAAWAVNFSTRLSSFVKDHISGLRNLINFALSSTNSFPPRFLFCSSTASVLNSKIKYSIPEKISHDPHAASPLGYSRSKWVAEAICEQAHLHTRQHDRISVLRIGQLCGDTKSGIWNVTEAWPLMLSSIQVTGSLPSLNENLDWLPVDIAAEAVVQLTLSPPLPPNPKEDGKSAPKTPVYHILNPNTHPTWSDLIHWLQRLAPDFRIIPPAEWVAELDALNGDAAKHPARKLLGLWREAYGNDAMGEGKGEEVVFEMQETKRVMSAMRDVEPISESQFERIWTWIGREMMDGYI